MTGSYNLTFSKQGFEQLVRGPITLEVGVTTVNAELKVGSLSQRVIVNTDVALLNTESGQQSTTLDAKTMSQLPQTGQGLGELHYPSARRCRQCLVQQRPQPGPGGFSEWQPAL